MARLNGRILLLRCLGVAAMIGAWEIAARYFVLSDFLLPPPSLVAIRLYDDVVSGAVPLELEWTLAQALAGFAIAACVGIPVGVLIARTSLGRWFFDPLVSIGLPMPKIAFLPIFVLWFGVFTESKILMVAFNAIFPVIVASWAGTQGVEKFLTWSALSLGSGRRRMLWEIVLPAALPTVFTGLQLALPISLIVEIICEMAMGGQGLGASLMDSMRLADSLGVFSRIVAIAIAGSALLKIMELIRHRILAWHGEAVAA